MTKSRFSTHVFSIMTVATVCLWLLASMPARVLPVSSAASQDGAAPEAIQTRPSANHSRLTQIVPDVYLYQDTCNVYAIVKGDEAVLIDFGSGGILAELPSVWPAPHFLVH